MFALFCINLPGAFYTGRSLEALIAVEIKNEMPQHIKITNTLFAEDKLE